MNICAGDIFYSHSIYVINKRKQTRFHPSEVVIVPYCIREGEVYTDDTGYTHVLTNDRIVSDMPYLVALQKLAKYETIMELYDAYMDSKYPAYSYY